MKWLNDLQVFLDGKKTVITIILAGLDAAGVKAGWWDENSFRQITEAVLGGIFARQAIQKSGPVAPTTPVQ